MARILIIDDEEMLASTLKSLLTLHGHEVTTSFSGRNGLDLFIATPNFDLVITDINMPEVDGIELILALRKTAPALEIIAMSGGARAKTFDPLHIARQLGANAVIQKPFSIEDILSAIDGSLGRAMTPEGGHP